MWSTGHALACLALPATLAPSRWGVRSHGLHHADRVTDERAPQLGGHACTSSRQRRWRHTPRSNAAHKVRRGMWLINWLRVLGTTERSQMNQRICHQLHAIVPLLDAFKPPQQPLEFILPGKGPLHLRASRMERGSAPPLPASLGGRAMARVCCDVGNHPSIEDQLAMARGINAAIAVEISASEVHPDLFGHFLQGVQPLRSQPHSRFMHGRDGQGSSHIALVVRDGDDLFPLLGLVARVAEAIAPFFATVLVPSPWSTRRSRCCSSARWATLAINAC
jgi:hypothetical protein